MVDGSVNIKQDSPYDRPIDNEVVTTGAGEVYRQRVVSPDELAQAILGVAALGDILTALAGTLDVNVTGGNITVGEVEVKNDAGNPVPVLDGHPDPQTDALTDTQLRAAEVDVDDGADRQYDHTWANIAGPVTDTAVLTPAAGKAIRLRWVYAINDPADANPAIITIKLGSKVLFYTFGVSKRMNYLGNPDEEVYVTTDSTSRVAVTLMFEEV